MSYTPTRGSYFFTYNSYMTKEDWGLRMKGIKHYLKNGKEHTGPMHKTAGKPMTGAKHTAASKPLFHKSSLAKSTKKK